MEKFYLYLMDKGDLFLKRADIERYFKEFLIMWNLDADFSKVFDTLRKRKLTYMFDDYWALSKDNPLLLISAFLDFLIAFYPGFWYHILRWRGGRVVECASLLTR
jgi:hypothetical protein